MVSILIIIPVIIIFFLLAFKRELVLKMFAELVIDFVIAVVFLIILSFWFRPPADWAFYLVLLMTGILFFAHLWTNKTTMPTSNY